VKVEITRDQAVWERERFDVDVPDNFEELDEDEQRDILDTAIDNFDGYTDDTRYTKSILDSVPSLDVETVATFPGGREMDL
jgi:hypothetical protein